MAKRGEDFSTAVPDAFCFSTVSRDGKVSARNLILRRLDKDGFVMMTDNRSLKVQDLSEVPSAVMCFFWAYKKDTGESVCRQVRIEVCVTEMTKEDCLELYNKEPLYCKIRSHICNQGAKVDWEKLKTSHDELLQKVKNGEANLPMSDHFVAYKLVPSSMEFYYAWDHSIADRVQFYKDPKTGTWKHDHRAA